MKNLKIVTKKKQTKTKQNKTKQKQKNTCNGIRLDVYNTH